MIAQGKKRINVTLKDLTVNMVELISEETKLTKSEIIQQLFFSYTLNFWSHPDIEIEKWKEWKRKKDDK